MVEVRPIRTVFILIQVALALYFIVDAYNNWNESPVVSSVSIRKVKNEVFPAITRNSSTGDYLYVNIV